ncbi:MULTISPECIES: TetR/AcrR family transcriptional regulator [Rhizobium/Agrobacterium group]|jgi:AcrR family transcriptional regulator|uniref:TetR/AcrR family transcriptional regulator n=1 Tax=Rhizobium/Agrobacterium group TaxID=227290 RepID=UPI00216915BC|nr:TetR/AcrR family transcriptional regulator [Rhizobium sp. BIGb0125]MCS4244481.1 AcrR family transcriptional regulator [Rhizobium sp. BIGb0125]
MTPPNSGKPDETPFNARVMLRRDQLIDAMEELLNAGKLPATMSDLGKAAGMSTATTYRYFQSLEEVTQAYLIRIMTELRDFSVTREETGTALLYVISRFWVDVVIEHGQVLVQVRSRKGFLERMHRQVASTVLGVEARRRALLGALAESGLPSTMLEDAAMLYNTMFDPRDILDLINIRSLDADRVTHVLISSFVGALKGWHAGVTEDRTPVGATK